MIRTVVVDDEAPARDRLRDLLADFEDVQVVGEAEDGEDALRCIPEARPDLVFLDVEMPGRSGLEVAASLPPPRPHIIFCTAYDHYAVEAFEHHAVDYLLKPLQRGRLARAVERVRLQVDEERRQRTAVAEATETQARFYPRDLPTLPSLDYAGACRAAFGVGGDYYDFLLVGHGLLGLAVGDVAGKGMFAGLLMASLQARIQALAPAHGPDVDRLIVELGRAMHDTLGSNRYVTLFYGVWDDAARTLVYTNAGHLPPLLIRGAGGPGAQPESGVVSLAVGGPPVGALPGSSYRKDSVRLETGDVLVAFTDGVTETRDERQEELGTSPLVALVERHRDRDAAQLRDRILAEVDLRRGNARQEDDVTVVVAKVR